jgi:tetratricopeptide (TPR) repeat protein
MYAIVALAAFHCASSLMAFPNYLSYSNEIWGGTQETYRYLSASNVDVGGGHIEERNYLARNRITDCWIAAFGSADLDYYGIPCKSFPGGSAFASKRFAVVPSPVEGTLLISTSQLSGISWGPPELNPYGPLWHVKPVTNLGGHTLIFQGHFDLPLLSASSHSTEAQILASHGRLDEALAEARAAVEIAPQSMQAHLTLAQVLTRAKQFPQARMEYREALRLAEMGDSRYYRIPIFAARKGLAALDSAH